MDSDQPVDDVGLALRRNRLHALDLLEAQVVPHQPSVPCWVYCYGSILDQCCHILLRKQDRVRGAYLYSRNLCRPHAVRLPNQI